RAGRGFVAVQGAARRLDAAVLPDALHVDAQLDRMAARSVRDAGLQSEVRQAAPARDLELPLHQVDAEDLLGDGVLDLDAGIGLDEEELLALARADIQQEFERAEGTVVRAARQGEGMAEQPLPLRGGERRARRHLDDLLVAALQRAFALAEMDAPARPVAEDLHLEVPGLWQEALHIDLGIAE